MASVNVTAAERKEQIRHAMDELWNRGNLGHADKIYASKCMFHDPSFPVDGVKGFKEQIRELREAQPDLHMDVQEVLCDGDLTATRWTMAGTARKEFRGLPATGKTYVMTGTNIEKWEKDKVVEAWTTYDLLGALQQLGIIPEMAARQTPSETTA